MFKKKKMIFLATLIVSILYSTLPAYAAEDTINSQLESANLQIERTIDQAQMLANLELSNTNMSQDQLDEQLDRIINQLLQKTENIVQRTEEKISREGTDVSGNYIQVQIGNQTVLVDPFLVW